jgi:hypothetical protein
MPAGRPPLGPELVDRLGTTEEAKARLKAILETLAGTKTVEEACAQLDVSESRFHELRAEALAGAATVLEPAPRGRPRRTEDPAQSELEALKGRVKELEQDLIFAKTRAVLATAFPHLIKDPNEEKKKNPREERRKRRKAERRRKGR